MSEDKKLETVEKNANLIASLIDKHIKSDRKDKIQELFDGIGDDYFTSPASSREAYHLSKPGGLAEHSLNVFKALAKLNKTFECNFDTESMLLCALFHDLGKAVTTNLSPYYLEAESWQVKKGINYTYSNDGEFMTNALRSMFILQHFGIVLTAEEYLAIFLNDGVMIQDNRHYLMKEPKLALFLHLADRIACDEEKESAHKNEKTVE